jgi:hypothetical protein
MIRRFTSPDLHSEPVEAPVFIDRRQKASPRLSWYTFFGRRKDDRYSVPLFIFLVLIVGLNVLDSLFTMMILDRGGVEANPFIAAIMEVHGDKFWIFKFCMVSVCLILLCLHSRFKMVKRVIVFLTSVYLAVVIYQICLLRY